MLVNVTREFKFDAAHYIDGYRGDCGNLHGHTWRFAVSVQGTPDSKTGMVVDFKTLKAVVNNVIINKLDHKYLNQIVPCNPTAENLVVWIFNEINKELGNGLILSSVKLWENYPECYVEYFGEWEIC